jgi:hypothetical protein
MNPLFTLLFAIINCLSVSAQIVRDLNLVVENDLQSNGRICLNGECLSSSDISYILNLKKLLNFSDVDYLKSLQGKVAVSNGSVNIAQETGFCIGSNCQNGADLEFTTKLRNKTVVDNTTINFSSDVMVKNARVPYYSIGTWANDWGLLRHAVWGFHCLSMNEGAYPNVVFMWHCHGDMDQQWRFESTKLLRNRLTNKCLEVLNGDFSQSARVNTCDAANSRQWFVFEGRVKHHSGKVLSFPGLNGTAAEVNIPWSPSYEDVRNNAVQLWSRI